MTMNEFKDIIVDMDGTLADISQRLRRAESNPPPGKRMDWDIFLDPVVMAHTDKPNQHVIHLVRVLSDSGHNILVTSARNERNRDVTVLQLLNWKVDYKKLYLRADGDFRRDDIVKSEIYRNILEDGYMPRIAIDDRNQVVQAWRKLGIHCWQVEETEA